MSRASDQPGTRRVEIEPSPRWVRAVVGGVTVVDSRRVSLVRETGRVPVYYFPAVDVRTDLLEASGHTTECPQKGVASYWHLAVGDRRLENAAWTYREPRPEAAGLQGLMSVDWAGMDAWFEEDEEVYVHARDPYKRVDAMPSSRHVRIVIGGETVAETRRPVLLFETGLPTRYYILRTDVRPGVLMPSSRTTQCPYKGVAAYHSVRAGDRVFEDIAWYYPFPITECSRIQNLVCFFDEHVDAVFVDGTEMPRPETRWSRKGA